MSTDDEIDKLFAGRAEFNDDGEIVPVKLDAGWGDIEPIASTLPSVQPFDPQLLPAELRNYVLDVAERQQAAPDYVAVTALCGLAAIVGNRVRIAPKQHDDWEVVPNLWGAIVGRPSAKKTPAINKALAPVYKLEEWMRETWQAELEGIKVSSVLSVLDQKELKKRAEKALKGGDRDGARQILEDIATEGEAEEPACPRVVVNDATVEKLGELLNENPRGLLLIRDELPGLLARLDREEYQSERAFYLEAYNGDGRFTYDRIGRGTVHIKTCTLSLVGGVQPSKIAPIIRSAITGIGNDGLVQRLQLAVWPDNLPVWRWVDRPPHLGAREAYEGVFQTLHELAWTTDNPLVMRFSPAAQDRFRDWSEDVETEARSGKLSGVMESHLLKMPKTVASLALLFELVSGGRFDVGEESIAMALRWYSYLRTHANRLYAAAATSIEEGAKLIIERRDQVPTEFAARDVRRKNWGGLGDDADAAQAAIDLLVSSNHCREIHRPTGTAGGRPSVAYEWNPALGDPKKRSKPLPTPTDKTDKTPDDMPSDRVSSVSSVAGRSVCENSSFVKTNLAEDEIPAFLRAKF